MMGEIFLIGDFVKREKKKGCSRTTMISILRRKILPIMSRLDTTQRRKQSCTGIRILGKIES